MHKSTESENKDKLIETKIIEKTMEGDIDKSDTDSEE